MQPSHYYNAQPYNAKSYNAAPYNAHARNAPSYNATSYDTYAPPWRTPWAFRTPSPPTFSGTRDEYVSDFLGECDIYFDEMCIPERDWARMATTFLKDDACRYVDTYAAYGMDWIHFQIHLMQTFPDPDPVIQVLGLKELNRQAASANKTAIERTPGPTLTCAVTPEGGLESNAIDATRPQQIAPSRPRFNNKIKNAQQPKCRHCDGRHLASDCKERALEDLIMSEVKAFKATSPYPPRPAAKIARDPRSLSDESVYETRYDARYYVPRDEQKLPRISRSEQPSNAVTSVTNKRADNWQDADAPAAHRRRSDDQAKPRERYDNWQGADVPAARHRRSDDHEQNREPAVQTEILSKESTRETHDEVLTAGVFEDQRTLPQTSRSHARHHDKRASTIGPTRVHVSAPTESGNTQLPSCHLGQCETRAAEQPNQIPARDENANASTSNNCVVPERGPQSQAAPQEQRKLANDLQDADASAHHRRRLDKLGKYTNVVEPAEVRGSASTCTGGADPKSGPPRQEAPPKLQRRRKRVKRISEYENAKTDSETPRTHQDDDNDSVKDWQVRATSARRANKHRNRRDRHEPSARVRDSTVTNRTPKTNRARSINQPRKNNHRDKQSSSKWGGIVIGAPTASENEIRRRRISLNTENCSSRTSSNIQGRLGVRRVEENNEHQVAHAKNPRGREATNESAERATQVSHAHLSLTKPSGFWAIN